MRRLVILTIILAAITAVLVATPATAAAKSCSVTSAGGEKAPIINNTNGTVSESGTQGYKCTVAWDSGVFAMYEAGGTWHFCALDTLGDQCNPGFHPNTPDQFWPANTDFNWPHIMGGHVVEPDWTWTIDIGQPAPDLPVCSVNWHTQVAFFDATHFVFQTDTSPELHKTC